MLYKEKMALFWKTTFGLLFFLLHSHSVLSETSKPSRDWNAVLSQVIFNEQTKTGVGPYKKEMKDKILHLTLNNTELFDEARFAGLLLDLTKKLEGNPVPFEKIQITAVGKDQTELSARLSMRDVSQFVRGDISEPELLRRFDLRKEETTLSLMSKAIAARKQGNPDSVERLEKWHAKDPDNAYGTALLANAYRDEKKYWEAIRLYQTLISIPDRSYFAFHNLGFSYDKIGAATDAAAAYAKAHELKPSPALSLQLIDVLRKSGAGDAALALIAELRAGGDTAELQLLEGNILRDQKKYDAAREAYKKGAALNAADGRFLYNQLLLDLDQKKMADAKKKWEEMKVKAPEYADRMVVYGVF